jgi:hypothetical protein
MAGLKVGGRAHGVVGGLGYRWKTSQWGGEGWREHVEPRRLYEVVGWAAMGGRFLAVKRAVRVMPTEVETPEGEAATRARAATIGLRGGFGSRSGRIKWNGSRRIIWYCFLDS